MVGGMFLGVEVVGSLLVLINDFGFFVMIVGFGNNNGLIFGFEVLGWCEWSFDGIVCIIMIDEVVVGRVLVDVILGGLFAVLAFVLG